MTHIKSHISTKKTRPLTHEGTGLVVADKGAAVVESGVFCQHAYGAVVMDPGSYMWVLDAENTRFYDNEQEGLFAGLGGTLTYNGTVSVGQGTGMPFLPHTHIQSAFVGHIPTGLFCSVQNVGGSFAHVYVWGMCSAHIKGTGIPFLRHTHM